MAKVDYAFKAKVLSEHQDILALQRKSSLLEYCENVKGDNVDIALKETVNDAVFSFCFGEVDRRLEHQKIWLECGRINHAYRQRVKRLKDNITAMLQSGQCYFVTLTFSDDTLARTTAETRRRYVTRFLKSQSHTYCANIDFGAKNGREHYHGILLADKVNVSDWDKYGFSNAKAICNTDDSVKLAKYISKLTNHAIKDTTKGSRAIYSA